MLLSGMSNTICPTGAWGISVILCQFKLIIIFVSILKYWKDSSILYLTLSSGFVALPFYSDTATHVQNVAWFNPLPQREYSWSEHSLGHCIVAWKYNYHAGVLLCPFENDALGSPWPGRVMNILVVEAKCSPKATDQRGNTTKCTIPGDQ